jgi:hypothetical protein
MPAPPPLPAPPAQNALPSTDSAKRALLPLKAVVSAVDVSTPSFASMRPTMRLTAAVCDVATFGVVPGVVPYPSMLA